MPTILFTFISYTYDFIYVPDLDLMNQRTLQNSDSAVHSHGGNWGTGISILYFISYIINKNHPLCVCVYVAVSQFTLSRIGTETGEEKYSLPLQLGKKIFFPSLGVN